MSILIKDVEIDNKRKDIFIEGNRIVEIADSINTEADHRIDAQHKAALPGLYNSHTHAAMTLFRGFADDMPLMEWLNTRIWPNEARMTEKDVYAGSRLAILEMIRSGTIFFNDMYWHMPGTMRAAGEMGIRASLSSVLIDNFDSAKASEQKSAVRKAYSEFDDSSGRIRFTLGPHAPYTVSEDLLQWCREFADKKSLGIHIHLSETEDEVNQTIKRYGMRPVKYLESIGFLGERTLAAHAVWLESDEIDILKRRGVSVATNPVSNMKLAVGRAFPFAAMKQKGVNIAIGTDGCSSNNNLDMFEEMKFASLLQKHTTNNPAALSAKEIFASATINAAKAFGIEGGVIAEGRLADIILVDLRKPELVPHHDLISNLVYSANGSCVDTTICDGRILMQNRQVKGQEDIINDAIDAATRLFGSK